MIKNVILLNKDFDSNTLKGVLHDTEYNYFRFHQDYDILIVLDNLSHNQKLLLSLIVAGHKHDL